MLQANSLLQYQGASQVSRTIPASHFSYKMQISVVWIALAVLFHSFTYVQYYHSRESGL